MQKLLLHQITIKDSPIFKQITFSPSAHFNVFSGASGAGKSVLMESILALFGLRECNAQVLEATLELQGFGEEFKGLLMRRDDFDFDQKRQDSLFFECAKCP